VDVIFIRHAEAGDRDTGKWPNDDHRPITVEGRERQIACARAMKKLGVRFDYLATSPLVRARETAEIVAEVSGYEDELLESDALGNGCTAATVLRLLAKYPPDARVALVGHEPAFSQVAAALIGRSGDAALQLKKSGVAGVTFDGAAELAAGRLAFLFKPSQLRRLSR
jgi:phosphohistidine phosphatase